MATRRRTSASTRGTRGANGAADHPELSTLALYEKYVLGTARFVELPIKELYIDHKYQRELNEGQVKKIANNFDYDLFEPPTVNDRSHWPGYKGRQWAMIDGQHRREAAKRNNLETITCRVISVPPEREAELFVELNRQRLWLNPLAAFKAELARGNPAAKEIEKCLADRGLEVGSGVYKAGQRTNGKAVMAIASMKKIYSQGGYVGLAKVVDVAAAAWPEDDSQRFQGNILLGIDAFLNSQRNVDLDRLAERLESVTARQLVAKGQALWYAWKGLGEGPLSKKSLVDAIGEEVRRLYRKHR